MPRLPISVLKQNTAATRPAEETGRLRSQSNPSLLSFSLYTERKANPEPDPLELIYNIRYDTLRQAPRSTVLRQNVGSSPLVELPLHGPPLLVDGRMQIVEIPKWRRKVGFFWRTCSGEKRTVIWRNVRLPWRIWMERNFRRKKWRDLWIERS